MSNDIVPYQQLERMATAVAKSGLFGVKNSDQAIALMLLAQSEGIHVMTAVRDYHIVNGRPSMKAEAMLARFQEAGGKVQWHTLSDTKADATFSHPSSPEPVRIEWDMKRAQAAGLAGKDIWKAYPRAMLRSRVVSEGIRTTLPGVLAGKYTPEESLHIETVEPTATMEQRIESFGKSLLNEDAENFMKTIAEAETPEQVRIAFGNAYTAAKKMGDDVRMESFRMAYESRKAELAEAAAEQTPQEQI